jgi:hypothetical protein
MEIQVEGDREEGSFDKNSRIYYRIYSLPSEKDLFI